MAREQLIAWLNDAYAMEQGLIPILKNHAADARESMPDAARRIEQHVTETQTHAERLRACLEALGTSPSTLKSTLSSLMGSVESVSTGLFRDEPLKNVLADYGSEQFEVACYRALVAAASDLGEAHVVELCEQNMAEDEAMAGWLVAQIPRVVGRSMARYRAGATR